VRVKVDDEQLRFSLLDRDDGGFGGSRTRGSSSTTRTSRTHGSGTPLSDADVDVGAASAIRSSAAASSSINSRIVSPASRIPSTIDAAEGSNGWSRRRPA